MSDEIPQRTLTVVPYARRVEDRSSGILLPPLVPEFYEHARNLLETLKAEGHSRHLLLTADHTNGWQTAAVLTQNAEQGQFTDYAIADTDSYADAAGVLGAHDHIRSAILIVPVDQALGITGALDPERNADTILGLSAAIFRCGSATWADFSPEQLARRQTPLASSYTVLCYDRTDFPVAFGGPNPMLMVMSCYNQQRSRTYTPPKHIILLPESRLEWNPRRNAWEVEADNISDAALRLCDLKLSPHHFLTSPSQAAVTTCDAFNKFRYPQDPRPVEQSPSLQLDSLSLRHVFDGLARRPDSDTIRRVMVVAGHRELERLTRQLGGEEGAYKAAPHEPQVLQLGEGVTWQDVSRTLQRRGEAKPLGIRF